MGLNLYGPALEQIGSEGTQGPITFEEYARMVHLHLNTSSSDPQNEKYVGMFMCEGKRWGYSQPQYLQLLDTIGNDDGTLKQQVTQFLIDDEMAHLKCHVRNAGSLAEKVDWNALPQDMRDKVLSLCPRAKDFVASPSGIKTMLSALIWRVIDDSVPSNLDPRIEWVNDEWRAHALLYSRARGQFSRMIQPVLSLCWLTNKHHSCNG